MDWIRQLNQVFNYIEVNLDGEISYEEISKIVNCSIYNFQRMFSYIAGKSLSEYIRNRRLTLAAFDILNTDVKLIDIALKYGYESQDSFTRAFKIFHGVLPSKVRSEAVQLKSCPKLSFQITIRGENHMNYQIEEWPAFKIAGFVHQIKTENAFEIIPQIWDHFCKGDDMGRMLEFLKEAEGRPAGIIGAGVGAEGGNSENIAYLIGATNWVDAEGYKYTPPLEGMKEYSFKAATWAIFKAVGELPDSVQNIYKQFYSEWLPNSGYELDDLPAIECYFPDGQEVWIAITKKEK